jgi:hypothetical protein
MRKFDTKLIIISDILRMFLDDPQVKFGESRRLIKEITNTISRFSSNASVIVSLHKEPPVKYSRILFPTFDKCIQTANGESNSRIFVQAKSRKKEEYGIVELEKRDLEIVGRK